MIFMDRPDLTDQGRYAYGFKSATGKAPVHSDILYCEAVKSADQLQEVINMADNEKFTIDRSDLTSGNYVTAEQTTVMTDGEAPVSPPETVIAIILAGLIRSGAVS